MPQINQDFSFLKLYKTLKEAIFNEMPPVTELPDFRFIQQLPTDTFRQITNCETGVGFIGDVKAELVNCKDEVFQDVTTNFYYDQIIDSKGLNQIAFEFGITGIDEPSLMFFLKLTDTTNSDVWYSYPFMITSYNEHKTTKFHYKSEVLKFGIPYDLLPYTQTIRIANCYRNSPANKNEKTQYTVSDGGQINFDSRPTLSKKFIISKVDDFINDRLDILFAHEFVYVQEFNSKPIRATVSEYKAGERAGDTNFIIDCEFTANFQKESLLEDLQIYEYLKVIDLIVPHQSIHTPITIANQAFYIYFNKDISLESGSKAYLYLDGVLLETITTPTNLQGQDNFLFLEFAFTALLPENIQFGRYSIVVPELRALYGDEIWKGFSLNEWYFDVQQGDWDSLDWDNNDWLTNLI